MTCDNRLFCLLYYTEDSITTYRLNCYMYLLQKLGLKMGYVFRVTVSGLRSKNFALYLEEQLSLGVLEQKSGLIYLSSDSRFTLDSFVVSLHNLNVMLKLKHILSSLSDDELYLVCITDIIINDVVSTKGVDSLIAQREFIESSVKNLCSIYSKENFNLAVSLILKLEKECIFYEK